MQRFTPLTFRVPNLLSPSVNTSTVAAFSQFNPFGSGAGHDTISHREQAPPHEAASPRRTPTFFSQPPAAILGVRDASLTRRPMAPIGRSMPVPLSPPPFAHGHPVHHGPLMPSMLTAPYDAHRTAPASHSVRGKAPAPQAVVPAPQKAAHSQGLPAHEMTLQDVEDVSDDDDDAEKEVKVGWWTLDEMVRREAKFSDSDRMEAFLRDVTVFLLAVRQTGEKFGVGTPIKVLMGHKRLMASPKLRTALEGSQVWGAGKHNPYAVWRAIAFALVEESKDSDDWLVVNAIQPADSGKGFAGKTYSLGRLAKALIDQGDVGLVDDALLRRLSPRVTRDVEAYLRQTTHKRKEAARKMSRKRFEVYRMYQKEMLDIEEIARRRNVGIGSITGHLAECMRNGYAVAWDRLGISDERTRLIVEAVEAHAEEFPVTNLRPIKRALPPEVTYEQIKCVLALKFRGREL